jgi:4-hydroxythreonine-4-phosphate dehydrogenase
MIGITLGDPAGIGPEITLKALAGLEDKRVLLIGPVSALPPLARQLRLRLPDAARLLDTGPLPAYRLGQVQKSCGGAAYAALEAGTELLRKGEIQGLVTAPVSKEALRLAGFKYPGQTEFLAARLGVKRYAMLAYVRGRDPNSRLNSGGNRDCPVFRTGEQGLSRRFRRRPQALRIAFMTIHLPLAEVPAAITPRLVAEKLALLHDFLRNREKLRRPRIAVLALNPHAFEFTGGEERRIKKGMELAKGVLADGPFPADSLPYLLERYDGLLAMYHDQAMIPAKLLAQGQGVNVTIGLPCIRTSPLHGTAFDIAGRGIASPFSMEAAIELCHRLTRD